MKSKILLVAAVSVIMPVVSFADGQIHWLYDAEAKMITCKETGVVLTVLRHHWQECVLRLRGKVSGNLGDLDLDNAIIEDSKGDEYRIVMMDGTGFKGDETITSFIAPKTIGPYSVEPGGGYLANEYFLGCTALTNAVFDCGLTEVGWGAFKGCVNLRSLTVRSESLEVIRGAAFYGCTSLDNLVIWAPNCRNIGTLLMYNAPLSNTHFSDWNVDSITNVAGDANGGSFQDTTLNGTVCFPQVRTVGQNAFANVKAGGFEFGTDGNTLERICARGIYPAEHNVPMMVLGTSVDTLLETNMCYVRIDDNCMTNVYFAGSKPTFQTADNADGTKSYPFARSYNTQWAHTVRFYIPYGDDTWNDVIAQADASKMPTGHTNSIHDVFIGQVPAGVMGTSTGVFLSYGNYLTRRHRLIVEDNIGGASEPSPAIGTWIERDISRAGWGQTITLKAPAPTENEAGERIVPVRYHVERAVAKGWELVSRRPCEPSGEYALDRGTEGTLRVTWIMKHRYGTVMSIR